MSVIALMVAIVYVAFFEAVRFMSSFNFFFAPPSKRFYFM